MYDLRWKPIDALQYPPPPIKKVCKLPINKEKHTLYPDRQTKDRIIVLGVRKFYIKRQNLQIRYQSNRCSDEDQNYNETEEDPGDVSSDDEEIPSSKKKSRDFLFVYQSKWQKRLMAKYDEILLLDATYRTTRYSLPLFFLVVKTNVDYQIVATFVTANETKDAIKEALSILKSWNPDANPLFFMTDYCNEEIQALEEIFEGT